ncbi:MAG: hypothetical protein ABR928_03880 [Terracidiphilus sp.]|jgi:hypothetical protein
MRVSRLILAVAAILAFLAQCGAAHAQSPWQQPAADLAGQIASILGHGAARLMIRNQSSLAVDGIPEIRKLLEQDLRARGIVANSAPNDTIIRVTLSENARGLTWVAEVIRGDDTQVAVVDVPPAHPFPSVPRAEMILRRVSIYTSIDPILGGFEFGNQMVLLTPHSIKHEVLADQGWEEQHSIPIPAHVAAPRDPRGVLIPASQEPALLEFETWLPGEHCSGSLKNQTDFNVGCHASDDPWPFAGTAFEPPPSSGPASTSIANTSAPNPSMPARPELRAFYNTARDYYTGVVSPSLGVELPPFYSAVKVQWKTPDALVIGTIDGKVLLADDGKIITLNGTSEWGSDFATIRSGCGAGLPIVSGAGDSSSDTLRAYAVIGSNAEPRSAPLTIDGTVTALWTAPDGKSVYAVIRTPKNQYEVDRVTALCD